MFPPLGVIIGVHVGEPKIFLRRVATAGAIIVVIVAGGMLVYSALHNSFVPHLAVAWVGAAVAVMFVAILTMRMQEQSDAVVPSVAIAAAMTFAWQCFLAAYVAIPPTRSAKELVAAAQPYIHPQTALYSVGQYRETISPYLRRTLILVQFRGELDFGLNAEPGRQEASAAEFEARWTASTDAVAFFGPQLWDEYRHKGFPGRVIAADHYTIAVSRS